MKSGHNLVGRTVIITCGELAKSAGEWLERLLSEREGPETAVTILHFPDSAADNDDFATSLIDALVHISPPNLAQLLAQAGWHLRPEREIQVALVLDAVDGAIQTAAWLGETAVNTAYRQLGVETQVTLLWLAPEMGEIAESCLQDITSFSFSPLTLVVSPTNEAGLRLPDSQALSRIGAETLYCLCATPFYDFAHDVFADADQIYTGAPALASLGISVWEWSPTAVHDAFVQHWQQSVLDNWLANAEDNPTPEVLVAWRQRQGLDKDSLLSALLSERDFLPPAYNLTARHFPWPWQAAKQTNDLRTLFQEDTAELTEASKTAIETMAALREQTRALIADSLIAMLDERPIAGVDTAARWVWALATDFDTIYEQMLDETAVFDSIDSNLAVERGQIEAAIRDLLTDWPGAHWRHWVKFTWRFWRWPRLGWRYWQLRQLGLRLAGLLTQQSIRQREQGRHDIVARFMAELARLARQEHSRVSEIGEMLASLREEMAEKWEMGNEKGEIGDEESGVVPLSVPDSLFRQLIPDMEKETALAAEAVGGLGEQLRQLDDAIMIPLAKLAGERLAGVWALTAVDILNLLSTTDDDWQTWQQTIWDAAMPLWRYDEGQLSEAARRSDWTGACIIGAGVEQLTERFNNDACRCLPSNDRSRLILIRLRKSVKEEIRN